MGECRKKNRQNFKGMHKINLIDMQWLCPRCKKRIENFKCQWCKFEGKVYNGIYDFTFDLTTTEQAEDFYRQKEKYNALEIWIKKSNTINYFKKYIRRQLKVSGKILDIGAGYGWLSGLLSQDPNVREVWSVDVSLKALKIGQKIAKLKNYKISGFVRAKAGFLPFPDHYFDFVVSSAFLHHVESVPLVLSEIKRVIKPNGRYYAFLEPTTSFLFRPIYKLRLKKASLDHPGVKENIYTFKEWKNFFVKYQTLIILAPPENQKWYIFWKFLNILNLSKYIFSNILVKIRF